MADWAKGFTWAILPSFLASLLLEFLLANSIITLQWNELRATGMGALSLTLVRLPALTLLFAIPSYFVVSYTVRLGKRIIERRRQIYKKNRSPVSLISSGEPDVIIWGGIVEKFGVLWPVIFGNDTGIAGRAEGDTYTYVRNPRCPRCQTELLTRRAPKWVILEKRVWQCPDCGKEVDRPRSAQYAERDSVEKIVEMGMQTATNALGEGSVDDPFQNRNDVRTDVWEPGTNRRRR